MPEGKRAAFCAERQFNAAMEHRSPWRRQVFYYYENGNIGYEKIGSDRELKSPIFHKVTSGIM
jgi:hypothetical protein